MPKWEFEKITVGDFIFTASYKDGVKDSKQKEDLERYAVQLMERHYRFYGSLRARESEFVTEDSIVYCTNGFHTTRFGVMKDHGVYREDMKPVMTCKDCVSGDNIYSFGICRCPESTFNNTYPRPVDTLEYIDNRDSNGERFGLAFVPVTGPRCIPMLNGYWKQGECSTMIWDGTVGDYVPALLDSAYQVCFYGGVITILGTPAQGINTNPGWLQLSNGKWMYITEESKPVKNDWLTIDGKTYHFDMNGYMEIGWVLIDGSYYYFYPEGHMATSKWIEGKYWVDKNGVWDNDKVFVKNQGPDVSDIHPDLKVLQEKLLAECDKQGLKIRIVETIRTVERQNELYAQGRTTPGAIVTYAVGTDYKSFHQWGTALDFCRNDGVHKPYDNHDNFFERVGAVGKAIGLEWGGDWTKPDKPHFQLPNWGSTTTKIRSMYATPADFEQTW